MEPKTRPSSSPDPGLHLCIAVTNVPGPSSKRLYSAAIDPLAYETISAGSRPAPREPLVLVAPYAVQLPSVSPRQSSRRSAPPPKNGRLSHENCQDEPGFAQALALGREVGRAHAGPADVRSPMPRSICACFDKLSPSAFLVTCFLPVQRAASS